jgi:hypothetical protein
MVVNASGVRERTVPFRATDGFECNLINVRGDRDPDKGPVLLVHGAGVRADIFRAPVETTFVDYLVAEGYDVWLENWRASIEFPANEWTLDQAAIHDHPQAVKKVVEETGADEIKAVIHCQGSTSFMMSAVAGLVPEVTTIVSNAVSLHPIVPRVSKLKSKYMLPFLRSITKYVDPGWGNEAHGIVANAITKGVDLTHHECDNSVCRMVSFTYGAGNPALWRHENLNDATHEWLKHEFGPVPVTFFSQINECIKAGALVSLKGEGKLPANFVAQEPQTDARFALFCGSRNQCFLPESQERTFDFLDAYRPGFHSVQLFPRYGHLDVFMGKNASKETFPALVAELERDPVRR